MRVLERIQEIQDQFDLWFPHGAIYQVGIDVESVHSDLSPYLWIVGGTLTQPLIQVQGNEDAMLRLLATDHWDITQTDPFVLTVWVVAGDHPYLLGARVPESIWSTPEWQSERLGFIQNGRQDMLANAAYYDSLEPGAA